MVTLMLDIPFLAQISDVSKAADHWADKSDRYLFIVSLIIMGLAGFWIVRYLVARMEKQNEMLVELYKDARASEARLVAIAERNTIALEGNTAILRKMESRFEIQQHHINP